VANKKRNLGDDHPDASPLGDSEIQEAMELSGYPLEVEVYEELKTIGFSSALGTRFAVGDGRFQEIDITATRAGGVYIEPMSFQLSTRLLMHAKVLQGHAAFVGVLGEAPGQIQHLAERFHVAGLPSTYHQVQDITDVIIGSEEPLARAMEPLVRLPFCVHWAITRRRQDKNWAPWAKREDTFSDDFDALVRARHEGWRDSSEYFGIRDHAYMQLQLLAFVVGAKSLHVYDPTAKTVTKASMLTVYQAVDTSDGPRFALVDVIARDAVKEYGKLCLDVAGRFERGVKHHAKALHAALPRVREYARKQIEARAARPDSVR
jgi:hypothetical protein